MNESDPNIGHLEGILGTGATCGTCGFRYWEHKGHIIACPVCALAAVMSAERREQARLINDRDTARAEREVLLNSLEGIARFARWAAGELKESEEAVISYDDISGGVELALTRHGHPRSDQYAVVWMAKMEADRDAALAALGRCVEALKASDVAIQDAMIIYAAEQCGPQTIKATRTRIIEGGGTLAYLAGIRAQNKAALSPSALAAGEEWARMRLTETNYRRELWLNHGHSGQYGDDGEMQCAECIPYGLVDYKRELLKKIERIVSRVRIAKAALSPQPKQEETR